MNVLKSINPSISVDPDAPLWPGAPAIAAGGEREGEVAGERALGQGRELFCLLAEALEVIREDVGRSAPVAPSAAGGPGRGTDQKSEAGVAERGLRRVNAMCESGRADAGG
jgi:hypothetical protein